jgi:hypothetical protein
MTELVSPALISDLLAEHRSNVQVVLQALHVQGDEEVVVDELFALRFVLSAISAKKDINHAIRNAQDTLEWRRAHRAMLSDVARNPPVLPHIDIVYKYVRTSFCGTLHGWHPILVTRPGISDIPSLMNSISMDHLSEYVLMENEQAFRLVDRLTRESGRLCKLISIIDMQGTSFHMFDSRAARAQGKASHISAKMYPQLLGKTVAINAPSFMTVLFNMFSFLLSPQMVAKFSICPAERTNELGKKSVAKCPFVAQFGTDQAVSDCFPTFLGGTMPVTPQGLCKLE